jgi:hypothetical protein
VFGSWEWKRKRREKIRTRCCGDRRGIEIGEREAFQLWLTKLLRPLVWELCEAVRAFFVQDSKNREGETVKKT